MAYQVELSLQAKDLINKDFGPNKSDPFCVLRRKHVGSDEWHNIGHTEVINSNVNPKWKKKFIVDYVPEAGTILKFDIFDRDKKGSADVLGCCEIPMASLLQAPHGNLELNLLHPKKSKAGKLTILAETVHQGHGGHVTIQLAGEKLEDKDFIGKSDPFFVISKKTASGDYVYVKKSETIQNNLNPNWKPIKVSIQELCNGDQHRPLKIEVRDEDSKDKSELIGSFETTLAELCQAAMQGQRRLLINQERAKKKKKYENSGVIKIMRCSIDM